jgi:hypothetical protein
MLRATSLLLALCLVGCQGQPTPTAPVGPDGGPLPVQATDGGTAAPTPAPAATPVTPGTPAVSGGLTGRVASSGQPLAGADVSAALLGQGQRLATAKSAADGTFSLALDGVPAGALLTLTATKDGLTLATLVAAPAARSIAAADPTLIDEATSLALRLLEKRFAAAGIVSRAADGRVIDTAVAQTLLSFHGLRDACASAIAQMDDAARAALSLALTGGLSDALPPGLLQQLGDATALQTAFVEAAGSLAAAVKEAYGMGGVLPDATLRGPVSLGDNAVRSISFGGSGSGSNPPPATGEANGGLTITPGDLDGPADDEATSSLI